MVEKKKKKILAQDEASDEMASRPKKKGKSKKSPLKKTTPRHLTKKRLEPSENDGERRFEEDIANIYENKDGSMPDMTHFEKKRRSKLFALVLFLCSIGLLILVVWFGWDTLRARAGFSQNEVTLSISGQERVQAGEEVTYRVRYANNEHVPLAKMVLQVRYPDGFVFERASVEPTAGNQDTWELGALAERESGSVDITGRIYGNVGEAQSFRAFLNYYPGNFSSEFQAVATARVDIDAAPVSLVIDGPDEVAAGVNTTITLTVEKKPDVSVDVGYLEVVMDETAGFSKRDATPESQEFEAFTWAVEELRDLFQIAVSGSFSADDGEIEKTIHARVIGWKDDTRSGEGFVLGVGEHTVRLVETDLALDMVVNGAHSGFSVQPGDVLSTSMVVKNTGDTPVSNVRARLVFDAPSYNRRSILDWNALEDVRDGDIVGEQISETIRRGTITWTGAHIRDFAELLPGEEVAIDVHLPIRTADLVDLASFEAYGMSIQSEVQYDAGEEQELASNDPIDITINSDLALDVRDEVSESGASESHTVTWFVTNSFHDLKDVTLSADIYGDIAWRADELAVPAGIARFDEETKTLTWEIPEMPQALDVLALRFGFDLKSNNPSQTNLTSKVTVKATDTATGQGVYVLGRELLLAEDDL